MKIAAIIAEYNPFHLGHKYQVDAIREQLGEDTAVVAIMSGNFTQRGELAITDKTIRAKAAVECGVNLVLELPFPFSMSSAEFFAKSGVHIANALGVVDYLVFGSESGSIDQLASVAEVMMSEEYSLMLDSLSADPLLKEFGYPELCAMALNSIYGKEIERDFYSPNNILAIEYIKALKKENGRIAPYTIKRKGAGYHDSHSELEEFQSATSIRDAITEQKSSAFDYVPKKAKEVFKKAILEGKMPSNTAKLDLAVISSLRLNSPTDWADIHDAGGGLYNRLCDISAETTSILSLVSLAETKKYTKARIRRAVWNTYFGVTSSDVKGLPHYTQVLAMDAVGQSVLRKIKKMSDFPVITKPSSYRDYDFDVILEKELSNKADAVFGLTLDVPNSGRFALKFTPYVKR